MENVTKTKTDRQLRSRFIKTVCTLIVVHCCRNILAYLIFYGVATTFNCNCFTSLQPICMFFTLLQQQFNFLWLLYIVATTSCHNLKLKAAPSTKDTNSFVQTRCLWSWNWRIGVNFIDILWSAFTPVEFCQSYWRTA